MAQHNTIAKNHKKPGAKRVSKVHLRQPSRLGLLLKSLGPGLITGASDDDPSGIGTYSQAGAQLGYGIGWTMLLTFPLMAAIQEIRARVGRAPATAFQATSARHYPKWLLSAVVALLFIANTINIAADLGAMADATMLLIGGHGILYVVFFGVMSVVAQIFLEYSRYVSVLKWLTLSLFAYFAAIVSQRSRGARRWPARCFRRSPGGRDYCTTIVAILGTTISPYLFFWQASQEAEDQRVDAGKQPLVERHYGGAKGVQPHSRRHQRRHGVLQSDCAVDHADHRRHIARQRHHRHREIGAGRRGIAPGRRRIRRCDVCAGYSRHGLAFGAGARRFHRLRFRRGPTVAVGDRHPKEAKAFYAVVASATIGIALNFTPINPISALYWSAVINGVLAVPVMVLLMFMARRKDVMDRFVIAGPLYWLGWLSTAAMLISVLAMAVGFLVGGKS